MLTTPNLLFREIGYKRSLLFWPDYPPATEVHTDLGGRWLKKLGAWVLPPYMAYIEGLLRIFPSNEVRMHQEVEKFYNSPTGFPLVGEQYYYNRIPRNIRDALLLFQREGVQYLVSSPYKGGLLNLSPGLGKMLTSIASFYALEMDRVLVITSILLAYNWKVELQKWTNLKAEVKHRQIPGTETWTLTNFETVIDFLPHYKRKSYDAVIVDESIFVKNEDTDRWKAINELRNSTERIWELSGSPVSKHADDLHGQFKLLEPQSFPSYWRFARTYCFVEPSKWGSKIISTRRNISLRREFRDLMFVRKKKEVMPELPEMIFETVNLEMGEEQTKIYNQMLDEFVATLESGEEVTAVNRVSQIIRLLQIVSNPINLGNEWPDISVKLDTLEYLIQIKTIPTESIIWTHWIRGATAVKNRLGKTLGYNVGIVNSTVEPLERANIVNQFQQGKFDFLVMSLGTGKHGLSFQNAKAMVYVDKSFDADAYVQSQERITRIGLKHQPLCITLRCPGTADELVEDNLSEKARSISHAAATDLAALLRSLRK